MYMSDSTPIAIVGISAELPSGSYSDKNLDYNTFFEFLLDKGQSYETVPKDRFDIERWHGLGLGHITTRKGSFLKDVPLFDHVEFGITAKDAKNMALSTRKLIEHSFLALRDSGINYRGKNIGCYMSATAFDTQSVSEPDELEANGSFAGYPYMVANKVSYHLDLRGPSIPIDTACSSSLTALHLAVQAIRTGDCVAAVVGGCQLNFRLVDFIQYSQGSVLSADGACKPLDESANGFSRGEGVVVIVVKPLDKAIQDKDHIYATILGTGINSSGSLAPVSAPVASAQKEAMSRAFAKINRNPAAVDYVELHATGTAAGDPIEANWVGEVFGQRRSELLVGSVKGNVGHLEICAFLTSLCKICAMFGTGLLPPTVNLLNPNPAIEWDRWNMRAPIEVTPIMPSTSQLLVSIASSGIGGSNGHAVVESFPEQSIINLQRQPDRPLLVLAGGLSHRSVTEIGKSINESWSVVDVEGLSAFSSSCNRRGRQMPWQAFAIMQQRTTLIPFSKPTLVPKSSPPLAFVFCGQGPQYASMGSQLFESYPKFRESIIDMDKTYERIVGYSLRSIGLFSADAIDNWDIWPISVTLPAIAMVQMAMYDFLSNINILPSVVVGHSAGETAMMYASGACSRDMAVEISIARGAALATLEDLGGSMVALDCDPVEAQSIIDEVLGNNVGILRIACYNSDFAVTLAGSEPLLDSVIAISKFRSISAHRLRTKVAVHSDFVEQCETVYRQKVEDIFSRYPGDHKPSVTTYSSTFGKLWSEFVTPDYYWYNVRHPVLFSQAVKSIIQDYPPDIAFVEISPHPVLSNYVTDSGVKPEHVLCFMRRMKVRPPFSEPITFLQAIAKLSLIGYADIDFHSLNDTVPSARDNAMLYPFLRKFVPFCPEPPKSTLFSRSVQWSGPLLHTGLRLNASTHPKLAEHVIMGESILPAAGFLEMVFESGAQLAWNIQFQSMLPLSDDRLLPIMFTVDGPSWTVISELQSQSLSKKRVHATGFMSPGGALDAGVLPIDNLKKTLQTQDVFEFYENLAHFAQYGPSYQRVIACWKTGKEALVEIRAHDEDLEDLDKHIIHPVLLDACFHPMVHPMFTANADRSVYYLPASIETVVLYDPSFIRETLPKVVYSYIRYRSWDPAGIKFDLSVADVSGKILCQLLGFRIALHRKTASAPDFDKKQVRIDGRHEIVLQPLLAPTSDVHTGFQVSSSTSLTRTLQPGIFSASMTAQAAHGEALKNSFTGIVSFLRFEGGKSVIRVLCIEVESLKIIRDIVESDLQQNHIMDINILANPDSLIPSPLSRKIGRVILSLPSLSNSRDERHGNDMPFYDIIVGRRWHEEQTDHAMERIVQKLLPGGFVVLITQDHSLDNSKHSVLSHTILQRCDSILPPLQTIASSTYGSFSTPNEQYLSPSVPEPSIASFHLDRTLSLQEMIRQLPEDKTLWIESSHDVHGHAAIGFVRSLQKEIVAKDIRLAVFDTNWTKEERRAIVSFLASCPYIEKEIFIDSSGIIRVPRLVPSSLLQNPNFSQPKHSPVIAHDVEDEHALPRSQVSIPLPLHYVLVHITGSSTEYRGLRAIVGHILDAGSTHWSLGVPVLGIAPNSMSKSAMVHGHSLVPLMGSEVYYQASATSHCTMAVFVAALAIGSRVLTQPEILRGLRVLVIHRAIYMDAIAQSLHAFMTLLGVTVIHASTNITPKLLDDVRSCNVVFTESLKQCDVEAIRSVLPESGVLYSLDASQPDFLSFLTRNVWIVGDILHDIHDILRQFLKAQHKDDTFSPTPLPVYEQKAAIPTNQTLFDATKEYYLLGGLGSLGIRAAMWMYENGARRLVLTSRRGYPSSLTASKDEMASRILSYLQCCPDLRIRLEACDSSSDLEMSNLFRHADCPIGGCILMSVVLSDQLFMTHDDSSYYAPFPSKLGALTALERVVDIHSFDFLISISSAATFGNAGQTNYASANTAVDGLLSKYKNAFSLLAPAIVDSITISHGVNLLPDSRFREWIPWSMTCSELFECLADGIRSIVYQKFSLYVPRYEWYHMKEHLGSSPMYNHLVYETVVQDTEDSVASKELLQSIVRKHLDIDESEFSPDIPFTSYGLDSLSAGRLSYSLKPFLQISQLQLLADINFQDLERRILESKEMPLETISQENTLDRQFNWQKLNQPGQTVVKLVEGEGIPLILIHGASGNIVAFIPLQERIRSPLWAIQHTPACPMDSLHAMASFYTLQIKAVRPSGPYRLGGFSGCSILAYEVAYLLRASGDDIIQFVMLDHFPTVYSSPIFPLDVETIQTKKASEQLIAATVDSLLDTYARDPTVSRKKVAEEIKRSREGETVSRWTQNYLDFLYRFVTLTANFIIELCGIRTIDDVNPFDIDLRLRDWTAKLDVPLTVILAENSFLQSIPEPNEQWTDLTWVEGNIVKVPGSHFNFLESPVLVEALETGWHAPDAKY